MNIYSFLKLDKFSSTNFVNELLQKTNFASHVNFHDKLLVLIEASVKSKLKHIIEFEKDVAISAELCSSDADFVEEISNDQEWQDYFFEEYPVIEHYLSSHYVKIRSLIEDVLTRLDKDFSELNLPMDCALEDLTIGEGDFHDGKCTCKLTFTKGVYIFYKPRSLAVDNEILNFLMKFQNIIDRNIFYDVINIDKGSYGWSKGVEITDCISDLKVKSYYEGLGIFSALCHALKIEDIIFDNIISTGGLIALIDLECSFCTKIPFDKTASYMSNSKAGDLYRDSLIQSGIIPRYTFGGLNGDGESDGALSFIRLRNLNVAEDLSDNSINSTTLGSDHLSTERHIPKLNHQPCLVKNYITSYLDGFKLGYNAVLEHKQLFEDFLVEMELKSVETRIIYRPTKIYATILEESFHVDYLKDKGKREVLFNSMYNAEHIGISRKVIASEIEQLKNFDIPAFKKLVGINQISTFSGESLHNQYALETDIEQVRRRILSFGVEDYEIQQKVIIQSLKIFENANFPEQTPIFNKKNDFSIFHKPEIEHCIHGLVEFIKQQLIIDQNSVSFLDSYINHNNGWAFGAIGPGLANGTDGIALLFSVYGHTFKKPEFVDLAKKILECNAELLAIDSRNENILSTKSHFAFSPFLYPSSILYVSEVVGYLTNEQPSLGLVEDQIYDYFKKWLHKDDSYDMLIGCCGSIFLFYQLYQSTKQERYKELIDMCASHLLINSKRIDNDMAVWSSNKFLNLGGFSHGTSSYCVALLLSYDVLKNAEYFQLFEKALNYDRSLFSVEHNHYLDNRYFPEIVYSNSWAHGSAGIGLSRLMIAEILPDYPGLKKEIEICRLNTENVIKSNLTYSVVGGFSGNIEILRALNNYCGVKNDYLDEIVVDKVSYYMNNPELLSTDNNHLQLLMNQGIAGFGYALIRYLNPASVPSLLNLSINTNFGSKHLYAK